MNDDTVEAVDASAPRPSFDAPLSRGDLVDRYVILGQLGAGGMGAVSAADLAGAADDVADMPPAARRDRGGRPRKTREVDG